MSFFTSKALALAPWSISNAKTAEQCPWKFNRQYVDKVYLDPEDSADTDDTALRVGSAVHKYAECVAKDKRPDLSAKQAITKNRLLGDEREKFAAMLDSVHTFEDRITAFKEKYSVTKDMVECKIAITEDLKETDFWDDDAVLRGALDRTLIIDEKDAVIIDLKTGSNPTLKYSQDQLDAYALMILNAIPELRSARSALYFVPAEELLWGSTVKRSETAFDAEYPTIKLINEVAESSESDDIQTGKYCSWCVYKNFCIDERSNRKKVLAKGGTRYIKDKV